jgi:hypothetical protein
MSPRMRRAWIRVFLWLLTITIGALLAKYIGAIPSLAATVYLTFKILR